MKQLSNSLILCVAAAASGCASDPPHDVSSIPLMRQVAPPDGWAAQAGVDVAIGPRTFLNLDIKYIDMDSDVTLRTAAIGTQKVRAHIDPLVIGAGIGFRF